MKLELWFPVKPLHVNQIFGNPDPKYQTLGLIGHNGIDFMAEHGEPVYASHEGVATIGTDAYSGHGVTVTSQNQYDYKDGQAYFESIYWHLIDNIPIKNGQIVKVGDLLGYADNTGFSTGDHLHFGLKTKGVKNGLYYNLEQDNGYLGSIDPKPYFNGYFAEDAQKVSLIERLISLYQMLITLLSKKGSNA